MYAVAFSRKYLSWKTLKETIWTDIVTVSIFGGEYARKRFRYFSFPSPPISPHPEEVAGCRHDRPSRKLRRVSAEQIEKYCKEEPEIGKEAQVFIREDRCGLGH